MTHSAAPLTDDFLGRLWAFVRRRVRHDEDADDIVQDVLARLVTKGTELPSGSVHAWLFAVARRVVIDRYRTRREPGALPEDLSSRPSGSDDETTASELARCLEPMLAALGEADRLLLARVDMAGESQAAVARELGLSVSAVKSRVQRARSRLRAVLGACCAVEQDRRGTPVEYKRRPGRSCPCHAEPGTSSC